MTAKKLPKSKPSPEAIKKGKKKIKPRQERKNQIRKLIDEC